MYLSRICAESPLELRRCRPGEAGAVLSRYDGIAGHDWIAIPLIPYLYAVEKPESVPLSADPKLVDFLRDQYRHGHLQSVAPDDPTGHAPGGRWAELVGVNYRRTIYGFGIDTSEEQDDQLIQKYNTDPNRTRFNLVTHNCADFARNLINFYYPNMLHRAVIVDLGVTTPKRMATLFVHFGERHPELHLSTFVIAQVPGSIRRSRPVRGVVESAFRAKKYMVPLLAFHPVMASCFVVAAMGANRFNPARNAMIFDSSRELERPLDAAQRRSYQNRLQELKGALEERNAWNATAWQQLEADAVPRLDTSGNPLLVVKMGDKTVDLGLSRSNILSTSAPPEMVETLLVLRLREELKSGGAPKVSEPDVGKDWQLLQEVLARREKSEAELRLSALQANRQ